MVFDQSMHRDLVKFDHPIQYPKTFLFNKEQTNRQTHTTKRREQTKWVKRSERRSTKETFPYLHRTKWERKKSHSIKHRRIPPSAKSFSICRLLRLKGILSSHKYRLINWSLSNTYDQSSINMMRFVSSRSAFEFLFHIAIFCSCYHRNRHISKVENFHWWMRLTNRNFARQLASLWSVPIPAEKEEMILLFRSRIFSSLLDFNRRVNRIVNEFFSLNSVIWFHQQQQQQQILLRQWVIIKIENDEVSHWRIRKNSRGQISSPMVKMNDRIGLRSTIPKSKIPTKSNELTVCIQILCSSFYWRALYQLK